jgi:hypothetical protein
MIKWTQQDERFGKKHFTWIDTLGLEMDSKNCFRRKQHDSQGSLGVEGYFSEIKK